MEYEASGDLQEALLCATELGCAPSAQPRASTDAVSTQLLTATVNAMLDAKADKWPPLGALLCALRAAQFVSVDAFVDLLTGVVAELPDEAMDVPLRPAALAGSFSRTPVDFVFAINFLCSLLCFCV